MWSLKRERETRQERDLEEYYYLVLFIIFFVIKKIPLTLGVKVEATKMLEVGSSACIAFCIEIQGLKIVTCLNGIDDRLLVKMQVLVSLDV